MFDLSNAKKKTGSAYPDEVIDGSGLYDRIEPMLTPKIFKNRFLFGVPLTAPTTGETLNNSDFKDAIKRAVNQFEMDSKVLVMPVIQRTRLPFDPNLYQRNMWFEVPKKPVQKVIRLAICSADYDENERTKQYPSGNNIYQIPNNWIDMSYATHGKIFVNPLNPAFASVGTGTMAAASGATILQFINFGGWIPAFWTIEYLSGLCTEEGHVPVFINECIGQLAAILLLDNLIPLYNIASQSLSIDGLSQSVSDQRFRLLTEKRAALVESYERNYKKVKATMNQSFFVSNI